MLRKLTFRPKKQITPKKYMPTTLTIAGNLCTDPELRKTNSGLEIVEIRIASNDTKDKTTYWTAKFFGNKAGEVALKYAKKGSSVFVSGSAEEETWEKEGVKQSKIVCVASQFNFLGGNGQKSDDKPAAKTQVPKKPVQDSTEDIPF